jgi:hypothetical protein
LNPKSEIETGNLPQSLGHKRIEKISTDHFGYASIFSIRFRSKNLRHLAGLNFGFRVEMSTRDLGWRERRSLSPAQWPLSFYFLLSVPSCSEPRRHSRQFAKFADQTALSSFPA